MIYPNTFKFLQKFLLSVSDVCECTKPDGTDSWFGCGDWENSGVSKWCYLKNGIGISPDCKKKSNAILNGEKTRYYSYKLCANGEKHFPCNIFCESKTIKDNVFNLRIWHSW